MIQTPHIDELLEGYRHIHARNPSGKNMFEVLRQHGRGCTPADLPAEVERGIPKECFRNAALLAISRDDLTYVEGYAHHVIPVHHAWCVDADGKVVDPTWETPGAEYFGIPFKKEWLNQYLIVTGYYGVLDNPDRLTMVEWVYEAHASEFVKGLEAEEEAA